LLSPGPLVTNKQTCVLYNAQAVPDFLLQYENILFCVSELMDSLLTGEDQLQADQPNNLAEGHPIWGLCMHACMHVI
jgi:hypothetical protein